MNRGRSPALPAPKLARTTAGLEPYTPSADRPWNAFLAAHLLRRTLIGPRPSEVAEAVRSTPDAVVVRLLDTQRLPPPPAAWVHDDPFVKPTSEQRKIERQRVDETRAWWFETIVNQGLSITERMVLFWHNHFATQAKDVRKPQLMYLQNDTLRRHALGNFKTLVREITRDPAMLTYLDGRVNRVGKPNENYARELMELFTMGIGNYTERDVGEASRALTGWIVEGRKAVFKEARFDNRPKALLGRVGNFNDLDVIDIVFEEEATAAFICRKLYREFVYHIPDEDVVTQMAQRFREENYEIRPVLKALLTSAHFFDRTTVGARIKGPVEIVAGTVRTLGMRAGKDTDVPGMYLVQSAKVLGQHLLDPPNVAGWPGYRTWISTSTLPRRHKTTDDIVDGRSLRIGRETYVPRRPDPVRFVKTFPEPYDAVKLVRAIGECLTGFEVTREREELFLAALLEGADVYDWDPDEPAASRRISNLIKMIFELPEYQLT